jgi:hypothetical protein
MTNVPEAAERLRAYYALPGNSQGGVVHIVTEDSNVAQHFADSCLENAIKRGNAEDIAIAEMIARLSRTQRNKLSKMSFSLPPQMSPFPRD